jgi:outer membrane biosynthesis protein TonB
MGSVEIRIETVDSPPKLKGSPFFQADKNLQKESAKVFSAVFAFLMLMLFINVEPPKEEKKISVIYRQKVKKMEAKEAKFSKEVAKKKEEVGQKPVEQEKPINEPKMAKKQMKPVKAKKAKARKIKKKMANKKSTRKPKPAKKVAKKPVKTYKLKLNRSISSFLTKKTNVKVTDVDKSATMKNLGSSKLKVSSAKVSTKSNINLGTFGKDYKGKVSRSTGTKGLSRKRGFDTAYIEPKTVVLGSMDPELLRKILREYLPQFRHCYQKELEHHSNEISGVIDLRFRINGAGKATKVNIKTKNAKFSRKGTGCMSSVLRLIDFPKPKGGGVVDVRQPLNFFSEKGKI